MTTTSVGSTRRTSSPEKEGWFENALLYLVGELADDSSGDLDKGVESQRAKTAQSEKQKLQNHKQGNFQNSRRPDNQSRENSKNEQSNRFNRVILPKEEISTFGKKTKRPKNKFNAKRQMDTINTRLEITQSRDDSEGDLSKLVKGVATSKEENSFLANFDARNDVVTSNEFCRKSTQKKVFESERQSLTRGDKYCSVERENPKPIEEAHIDFVDDASDLTMPPDLLETSWLQNLFGYTEVLQPELERGNLVAPQAISISERPMTFQSDKIKVDTQKKVDADTQQVFVRAPLKEHTSKAKLEAIRENPEESHPSATTSDASVRRNWTTRRAHQSVAATPSRADFKHKGKGPSLWNRMTTASPAKDIEARESHTRKEKKQQIEDKYVEPQTVKKDLSRRELKLLLMRPNDVPVEEDRRQDAFFRTDKQKHQEHYLIPERRNDNPTLNTSTGRKGDQKHDNQRGGAVLVSKLSFDGAGDVLITSSYR